MSPSIYIGCQIQDEIFDGLSEVDATFRSIQQEADTTLAELAQDMAQLSSAKTKAQITVGSTPDNEVTWTAKEAGTDGNEISVRYDYRGPDFFGGAFIDRPPSSEVNDKTITLVLAVAADGEIDPAYDTAASLAVWLANTDVTDLVDATLVGAGTDLPVIVPTTFLAGGKGAPLKDAETAANEIAQQFGQKNYQDLMKSIDLPVVESEADAVAYLESVDDTFIILNGKLLIVEGTNLVGIRVLYNLLEKDVTKLKGFLEKLSDVRTLPHLFVTQNVGTTRYEKICDELEPIITITEYYRAYNQPLQRVADSVAGGDVSQLNSYIFWIEQAIANRVTYDKLVYWGFPDELITDILAGETPEVEDYTGDVKIPVVSIIDDPDLLKTYKFTDAEITELLEKEVEGIKPPAQNDPEEKSEVIKNMLRSDETILANGLRNKQKKAIAAAQAIDLTKTGNDSDLAKELATRGKACARQEKNAGTKALDPLESLFQSPNIPNLDLPNLPTDALSAQAKKVEAAFGAVSSMIDRASKLFDRLIGGLVDTVTGVLNKLQNLVSLAENLFKNDLMQCLLGTASAATGQAELPGLGGGISTPSAPSLGLDNISIGGIPLPMSLLGEALKKMSDALDETLTSAFEKMMSLISLPLCMVQSLLNDILGLDLGGLLNPCKDAKDPNDDCPAEETQETINASDELTGVMNNLSQTDLFPTESEVEEITEEIEDFTGEAIKTAESVAQDITRGVKQVMDDVTKSINSKTEVVSQLDKAVKELIGETDEMGEIGEEEAETASGCAPPSLGMLTDAIADFI